MEAQQEKIKDVTVFALSGRLDSNTSPDFETKIMDTISGGEKKMVVDFTGLDYISSAGMRVILKATKELKNQGGGIILCSMKDYVKEVFEIAGFDSFITIVETKDQALEKS